MGMKSLGNLLSLRHFPPAQWLKEYQVAWLPNDVVAGVTLAAYAIPVSLAYATLAGLPPQVGVYGYLLGGLGYALLGSSRWRRGMRNAICKSPASRLSPWLPFACSRGCCD
jgi:hypothetical protein